MDMGAKSEMGATAGVAARPELEHVVHIEHSYHVECWRNGALVWEDTFKNLVTTSGKNKYLDACLKTGLASPAWYVGLVTGPGGSNTYASTDVMSSHSGWTEAVGYAEGARQTFTPGTISAGSVDNSASKATFTVNTGATIGGAFLADNSAKSGTTGTLLGVGSFSGGDRAVLSGDSLSVTLTATMS